MRERSPEQKARIIMERAAALGWKWRQERPDLVDIIRDVDAPVAQRAAHLEAEEREGLDVILRALRFLAYGNPYTTIKTPPYDGVLDAEEAVRVRQERSARSGLSQYEQGKGIHGMTQEERRSVGVRTYEERKGIHGMTQEERVAHGRRLHRKRRGIHCRTPGDRQAAGRLGGIRSAQGAGKHTWYTNDPLEQGSPLSRLFELTLDEEYSFGPEERRRIRAQRIAETLTEEFPQQQPFTAHQVTTALREHRREYEIFQHADIYARLQ